MSPLTIHMEDDRATALLGNDLSRALCLGDCVALSGDLGAGKTALSRAIIRSLAGDQALEVPSPTFTLVQTYPLKLPVAHFDLYRITDASELDELGLDEALDDGIALIEWPEKATSALPRERITVRLEHEGTGRRAEISGPAEAMARIERSLDLRSFLIRNNLGDSWRRAFVGDASPRVYELAATAKGTDRVITDQRPSPAGPPVWNGKPYREVAHTTNPTVHPFIAIGGAMRDKGFATPAILGMDLETNFLVLEHLGSGNFLENGKPVLERYELAARLAARIHGAGIGPGVTSHGVDWVIPTFDRDALMIEALLALDWYLPYAKGRDANDAERSEFMAAWDELFASLDLSRYGLLMRDYHSPNIIWREERTGFDRLGVLDFQDALWGPNAYDLASLGQDARVDVDPEIEAACFAAYLHERLKTTEMDDAWFRREYQLMALQRNTKILGIFIRLDRRDGKSAYLAHLPRIETYVRRTLAVSPFSRLKAFYADMGL